ncbi:hypothetical protein HDU97_010247 [Phlyctochytrium planicorne]|nr:hypothetical protein HDU97_010247 [Phlyctochytrium planicorne]
MPFGGRYLYPSKPLDPTPQCKVCTHPVVAKVREMAFTIFYGVEASRTEEWRHWACVDAPILSRIRNPTTDLDGFLDLLPLDQLRVVRACLRHEVDEGIPGLKTNQLNGVTDSLQGFKRKDFGDDFDDEEAGEELSEKKARVEESATAESEESAKSEQSACAIDLNSTSEEAQNEMGLSVMRERSPTPEESVTPRSEGTPPVKRKRGRPPKKRKEEEKVVPFGPLATREKHLGLPSITKMVAPLENRTAIVDGLDLPTLIPELHSRTYELYPSCFPGIASGVEVAQFFDREKVTVFGRGKDGRVPTFEGLVEISEGTQSGSKLTPFSSLVIEKPYYPSGQDGSSSRMSGALRMSASRMGAGNTTPKRRPPTPDPIETPLALREHFAKDSVPEVPISTPPPAIVTPPPPRSNQTKPPTSLPRFDVLSLIASRPNSPPSQEIDDLDNGTHNPPMPFPPRRNFMRATTPENDSSGSDGDDDAYDDHLHRLVMYREGILIEKPRPLPKEVMDRVMSIGNSRMGGRLGAAFVPSGGTDRGFAKGVGAIGFVSSVASSSSRAAPGNMPQPHSITSMSRGSFSSVLTPNPKVSTPRTSTCSKPLSPSSRSKLLETMRKSKPPPAISDGENGGRSSLSKRAYDAGSANPEESPLANRTQSTPLVSSSTMPGTEVAPPVKRGRGRPRKDGSNPVPKPRPEPEPPSFKSTPVQKMRLSRNSLGNRSSPSSVTTPPPRPPRTLSQRIHSDDSDESSSDDGEKDTSDEDWKEDDDIDDDMEDEKHKKVKKNSMKSHLNNPSFAKTSPGTKPYALQPIVATATVAPTSSSLSSGPAIVTPFKRGRGRPRKYPRLVPPDEIIQIFPSSR